MTSLELTKHQVDETLRQLDRLCREEYQTDRQYGLVDLLADTDSELGAIRLQRLTGILLKRRFAEPKPICNRQSETLANHSWKWDLGRFADPDLQLINEFRVLNDIRGKLWEGGDREPTWIDLRHEAEHERGLFKVLVLWIDDTIKGEKKKPSTGQQAFLDLCLDRGLPVHVVRNQDQLLDVLNVKNQRH